MKYPPKVTKNAYLMMEKTVRATVSAGHIAACQRLTRPSTMSFKTTTSKVVVKTKKLERKAYRNVTKTSSIQTSQPMASRPMLP
jgi:hypothetical protein